MLTGLLLLTLCLDPFEGLPSVEAEIPVAGELESMGTQVRARAYHLRMKPADAWAWVFESYKRHGLYVPGPEKRGEISGAPQLTGYDHPSRTSYTAIFKQNPDGSTLLIAGRADLSGGWLKRETLMPTLAGATDIATASSEGSLTMTYLVRASAGEVDAFYREVFARNGFQRSEALKGWVKEGQLIELTHRARTEAIRAVALTARPVPK